MGKTKTPFLIQANWGHLFQNPQKALAFNQSQLSELSTPTERGHCLLQIGWCHFYLSQQAEALQALTDVLEISNNLSDDILEIHSRIGLGAVYQQLSRYDIALEHLTIASRKANEIKNIEGELQAQIVLGDVQLSLNNPQEALDYFLKAQNLTKKNSSKSVQAELFLSLGQTYLDLRQNNKALENLSKALALTKELKHRIGQARGLTLTGQVYRNIQELDISEEYHLECLKICQDIDNKWFQMEAYYNLADIHLLRGHQEVGLKYLEKMLTLSVLYDSRQYTVKAYKRLSNYWEIAQDYKKALDYTKQAYSLEKDLRTDEARQKVKNLLVQHEFEKSRAQAEIYQLRSDRLELKSQELGAALNTLKIITDLGRKITRATQVADLAQKTLESVLEFIPVEVFALGLFNSRHNTVDFRYLHQSGTWQEITARKINMETKELFTPQTPFKCTLYTDTSQNLFKLFKVEKSQLFDWSKGMSNSMILLLVLGKRLLGILFIAQKSNVTASLSQNSSLEALGSFISIALRNTLRDRKLRSLNHALRVEAKELETANEKIRHMAHHDLLTGLANRRLLSEFLLRTISFSQRNHQGFSVMFLDLDGFKPINDNFGHDAGDWVLNRLGNQMKQALRDSDLISRVGGDEFVALALEVENKHDAIAVAEKLIQAVEKPLIWEGTVLHLSVSIGISLFPTDGTDPETLLTKADNAMYSIKKTGKGGWKFIE